MYHIVIVESDKRVQVLLTMIFSKTNYTISFFNNEIDAILYCQKIRPDLILTSTQLIRLTIKDFLETIKLDIQTAKVPVIVMCPKASKTELIYLIKAGVDDFILKSELMHSRLISRIEKAIIKSLKNQTMAQQMQNIQIFNTTDLATNPIIDQSTNTIDNVSTNDSEPIQSNYYNTKPELQPVLSSDFVERKLRSISSAKAIPFIASEILELTSSVETQVSEIKQLVELDPAITAKVLRFANSAYYRKSKSKIYTLPEAINTIGFNGIREIVLGISMLDSFGLNNNQSCLDRKKLFNHSLTTAVIAREIARMIRYPKPELCFVTGLLHDIGPAILSENFSKEYDEVLKVCQSGNLGLYATEKKLLGFSHAEVAYKMLSSWNFPEEIILPIKYHHSSFDEILKLKYDCKLIITVLRIACNLAKALGSITMEDDYIDTMPYKVFTYLNLPKQKLLEFIPEIDTIVSELNQILLLHGDPHNLHYQSNINDVKVLKPYKVLFLDNPNKYLSPFEVIYKALNCEICYADDFYNGFNHYNPKLIVAHIETDHQITVLLNELKQLNTKLGMKLNVLISTNKNIYYNYYHLKYDGNKVHFILDSASLKEIISKTKQINDAFNNSIDRHNMVKTDKVVSIKKKSQLTISKISS